MMTKKTVLLLLILAGFPFLTATLSEVAAQTVEDISKSLMCQCGCGKILADCYCDTADVMKSQIEQKIGEGKTEDQIIADFKADYGDQVLVTPPKSGLELTLWTLPIIASVVGTVAIYQLARRKASIPDSEVRPPIVEVEVEEEEKEKEETLEEEKEEMQKYEEIFEQEYQKFKKEQG